MSETLIRKIRQHERWPRRPARRRNEVPRLPVVAMLVLSGVRISELCLLDGRHIDFVGRMIDVPRIKTDAGERSIPMVPLLYELLVEHRAEFDYGSADPVFATRNGTRNRPDNVRARIVAPLQDRAT